MNKLYLDTGSNFLCELVSSFIFVLVCTALLSPIFNQYLMFAPFVVALTWGALHYYFRGLSGGHVNPLFSIGMWIAGRMSFGMMLLYLIAQFVGAILAVWLGMWLFGINKSHLANSVGAYGAKGTSDSWKSFVIEFVGSAILIFGFLFITADPWNWFTGFVPLTFMYFIVTATAMPFTGAFFNPARLLATSIFNGQWATFFVYLIAGILASLVAVLVRVMLKDWDCQAVVDDCGNPVLNKCGKQLLECTKPAMDECGNVDGCNTIKYRKVKTDMDYKQANLLSAGMNYLDSQGLDPEFFGEKAKMFLQDDDIINAVKQKFLKR
jgi:aquaporin Z